MLFFCSSSFRNHLMPQFKERCDDFVYLFVVVFLLFCLFSWGECLFNELNWKVNTPSVTKWLVWAHSCQVFPRLNTIFHLCFCACTVDSMCHVYVGWARVASNSTTRISFLLNVQHVPKKSLNIHRHTHTQTCANTEQWNTPIDLMPVIRNVCLPIAHRFGFGCIDSLSLLSFCHVRVHGTCLFVVFNHPTSSFHLSESARTHTHAHTPFHSISLAKTKIRKALPKPEIVSIEYSN